MNADATAAKFTLVFKNCNYTMHILAIKTLLHVLKCFMRINALLCSTTAISPKLFIVQLFICTCIWAFCLLCRNLLPYTVCNCKWLCLLLSNNDLCTLLPIPVSWVRNPRLGDFDAFMKGSFQRVDRVRTEPHAQC